MNEDKNNYYNNKILEILLQTEATTIDKISIEIGLSEKTVRNRVKFLEEYLKTNKFGNIEKKQSVGIKLIVTPEQRKSLLCLISKKFNVNYKQDSNERVDEVIKILLQLKPGNSITIMNLASILYLSIPTATGVLNQAVIWLGNHKVTVTSVRNKGLQLKSKECDYRLAVEDFIMNHLYEEDILKALKEFFEGLNVESIKETLIKIEDQWRLEFTEQSFKEILILLCLSIYRRNNHIESKVKEEESELIHGHNEYSFAKSIYKELNNNFGYPIVESEIEFLATQILSYNLLDGEFEDIDGNSIIKYDKKLKEFVYKIISTIGNVLNENLTDDKVLFEGLLLHVKPAIFRLKHGNNQSDMFLNYVKKDYKDVFRAAWLTSVLFEEYFNVHITDTELIYITLYIQAAIERKTKSISAVLVTQEGMGYNQYFCGKIRKFIPKIQDVKLVSFHNFQLSSYPDVDIIFTLTDCTVNDRRVIKVDPMLLDDSMQSLLKKVDYVLKKNSKQEFDIACYQLFNPDLIFTDLDISNKKDLLKYMTDRLVQEGFITSKFLDSVLEREGKTTTAVGNGVAIPHGNMAEVNESRVCIAVLKNPILWDKDYVDVIFLLSIKMDTPTEIRKIQQFYKYFIYLTDTDERVDYLRNMHSEAELYKYLIK